MLTSSGAVIVGFSVSVPQALELTVIRWLHELVRPDESVTVQVMKVLPTG
jgi:hypothetical protein